MPPTLDATTASAYARAGLDNVAREYPNHPGHLLTGPEDLREPHVLHPVFHGSYDWHSSVHQHWMLLRLLRRFPHLPERTAIHAWFDDHLGVDPQPIAAEVAYLEHPARRTFERPYGWAWLLLLRAELGTLAADTNAPPQDRSAAGRWAAGLTPLRQVVVQRLHTWLTTTPYPNRAGTHPSSAFACSLILDALGRTPSGVDGHGPDVAGLRDAVHDAARRWYLDDRAAPTRYEPSAADFLSPTLVEAELLSLVLDRDAFATWLHGFLTDPEPLRTPARVTDRTDPHTVHLDGLNLSRAWGWLRIAAALPAEDPLRSTAVAAASAHRDASLYHVLDDYVGSHWLPSFAVRLSDIEVATGDAAA